MKDVHITTSLNPQYDAADKWEHIMSLSEHLDVLILSEEEACKIAKKDTVQRSVEALLTAGCKLVVVTAAEKGSTAYCNMSSDVVEGSVEALEEFLNSEAATTATATGQGSILIRPKLRASLGVTGGRLLKVSVRSHSVHVADTTGAGDAFAGAFLAMWVHLVHVKTRQNNPIDLGVRAASCCIMPTRACHLLHRPP
jgi:sugar/nucleoside kinase (ribokinase family)